MVVRPFSKRESAFLLAKLVRFTPGLCLLLECQKERVGSAQVFLRIVKLGNCAGLLFLVQWFFRYYFEVYFHSNGLPIIFYFLATSILSATSTVVKVISRVCSSFYGKNYLLLQLEFSNLLFQNTFSFFRIAFEFFYIFMVAYSTG